eukprot:13364-Heterococcus_DN1.PRE.3
MSGSTLAAAALPTSAPRVGTLIVMLAQMQQSRVLSEAAIGGTNNCNYNPDTGPAHRGVKKQRQQRLESQRYGTERALWRGVPQAHLGACCLDAEYFSDGFEGLKACQLVFTALVGLIILYSTAEKPVSASVKTGKVSAPNEASA